MKSVSDLALRLSLTFLISKPLASLPIAVIVAGFLLLPLMSHQQTTGLFYVNNALQILNNNINRTGE